jgi:hypothetical protein
LNKQTFIHKGFYAQGVQKKPPKRKGYNRARGTGNAKNKEAPTNSPLKHQETRNKQNIKQSYLNIQRIGSWIHS